MSALYRVARSLTAAQKQGIFLALDLGVLVLALLSALMLSARTEVAQHARDLVPLMGVMGVVALGLSACVGLPKIKLNAYDMRGGGLALMVSAAAALAGVAVNGLGGLGVGSEVFVIFAMLFLLLIVGARIALRHCLTMIYRSGQTRMRVLIYGAGQTGQQLAAALRTDTAVQTVGFVDDNPTLQSLRIAGLTVHASGNLKELIAARRVDRVVLAMPSISQPVRARITHRLRDIGCDVQALPSFAELLRDGDLRRPALPVALDDLLGRNRLEAELPGVCDAYAARSILITGAGGSIGSELCRQVAACHPKRIVLLDHSELALYTIERELRDHCAATTIIPVLGSVLDEALIRAVLHDHGIDVVLHAAAYKHLSLVENNAIAGLSNNVIGTKVVADAARDAGVERFILVSSDKAVRPTNVMGASKRLAEMVIQDLATRSTGTRFSMVRFGNVLGSSGSVIPLFEEQIARGGPVTLTDIAVTRYFMTIPEAARLVLLAGSFARGGDLFVLDMGAPVPIARLARQMIEGAGYAVRDADTPDGDIEIRVTGLRPGEKLCEELLIAPDMLTTPHEKILRAQESFLSEIEMATALKDLRRAIALRDQDAARAVIARWVERGADTAPMRFAPEEFEALEAIV